LLLSRCEWTTRRDSPTTTGKYYAWREKRAVAIEKLRSRYELKYKKSKALLHRLQLVLHNAESNSLIITSNHPDAWIQRRKAGMKRIETGRDGVAKAEILRRSRWFRWPSPGLCEAADVE
jgi:hypothetical protein